MQLGERGLPGRCSHDQVFQGKNMSTLSAYKTEAAFYGVLSLAARLLTLLGLCLAAVFLVPFAVPHIKDALSFRYIAQAVSLQESISAFLRSHIPTVIGGRDLTLWIVFGGAFIIMLAGRRLRRNFSSRRDRLLPKIQFETFKAKQNLSDSAKVLRPLKDHLEDLEMATSGKERERSSSPSSPRPRRSSTPWERISPSSPSTWWTRRA